MNKSSLLFLLVLVTVHSARKDDLFIIHDQSQDEQKLFMFFHDLNDGYYVDIGAYDPIFYSNTLNLYARGWNGLNVEAHPQRFVSFPSIKIQDVNLNIALGQTQKIVTFYEYTTDASQSTADQNVYKSLDRDHPNKFIKLQIPALSTKQLCERYFKKKPNFINLDIQGSSSVFIKTNDWTNQKCRPEIIFVEMDDVQDYSFNWTVSHKEQMEKVGYTLVSSHYYNQIYIDNKVYEHYMKKQEIGSQLQKKKAHVNNKDHLGAFYKATNPEDINMFLQWDYRINNYQSSLFYFYPKEGSTFCLEDINRRSNSLSAKKNRPIMIQMFNPKNTKLLITSQIYQIQYLDVNQYTYEKITVTKPDGQEFITYIFNMDKSVQKKHILNAHQINNSNSTFFNYFGAILLSTLLTTGLLYLLFNKKWKQLIRAQQAMPKIQSGDDMSISE